MGTLPRNALINILEKSNAEPTIIPIGVNLSINLSHSAREGTNWKKQYMYNILLYSYYCICTDCNKLLLFMEKNFGTRFSGLINIVSLLLLS